MYLFCTYYPYLRDLHWRCHFDVVAWMLLGRSCAVSYARDMSESPLKGAAICARCQCYYIRHEWILIHAVVFTLSYLNYSLKPVFVASLLSLRTNSSDPNRIWIQTKGLLRTLNALWKFPERCMRYAKNDAVVCAPLCRPWWVCYLMRFCVPIGFSILCARALQWLPLQTLVDRRLRCRQVMFAASVRGRHIHGVIHLHHRRWLQNPHDRGKLVHDIMPPIRSTAVRVSSINGIMVHLNPF